LTGWRAGFDTTQKRNCHGIASNFNDFGPDNDPYGERDFVDARVAFQQPRIVSNENATLQHSRLAV
jgi:hypothetical protein